MSTFSSHRMVLDIPTYINWYATDEKLKELKNLLQDFIIDGIVENIVYFRIHPDNSCFFSTTHPTYMEALFTHLPDIESTLFSEKVHTCIENKSPVYALWNYNKNDKFLSFDFKYGFFSGFDIYIKNPDHVVEILSLIGHQFCHFFHDYCIANLSLINEILEQIRIKVKKLKYYRCITNLKAYELPNDKLQNYQSNKILFTNREIECINLYIKGYSTKLIGNKLNISYRTVEVYINNAKHKLGINYKSELIQKFDSLNNHILMSS